MTGRDYLPIYHVDGALNLSDLLTKKHDFTVEDLSTGSNWQTDKTENGGHATSSVLIINHH